MGFNKQCLWRSIIFCRALKSLIKVFHKLWIGLVNINKEDYENHENNWYWIDGKKANKNDTNWNDGRPNNRRSNQYCAELQDNVFEFNDRNCMKKRIAFCEIDLSG